MESIVNILIVDDRSTNILLLTELLKNLHVNIIAASSGIEALKLASCLDVALALLDVQMPDMDGYELARRLNKERSEHIPVIFITAAYPESCNILKGYEAGAVDYMVKPFVSEVLVSKVKVFIRLYLQKQEISEIANELRLTTESLSNANKSLIVKEEEYRTLLNASPDGILLTNFLGIITDISRSALVLFGTDDPQEIIGKHYMRFVPPGQTDIIRKMVKQIKNKGLTQNIELILIRKDQSIYPSEISVARIERQHSSSVSFILLIRNISIRKSIESQLIHSERLASLGEIASGMAHEINQPLNTISLVFDNMILEASKNDNLCKDYFERKSMKIFESIQRIKNIIDHVRIFSRSNTDLTNTPFDLNDSIKNALSLMNEAIRHKGINLVTSLKDNLPRIPGNPFELEQVIINLLSNAEDALLEKSRQLKRDFGLLIKIFSYSDENNIYIEVEDNGIGIKSEDKDRIFLPFFSTKESGKGTGLGLSISYTIIKKMNGYIEVESVKMKGTTLRIILPATYKNMKNNDSGKI